MDILLFSLNGMLGRGCVIRETLGHESDRGVMMAGRLGKLYICPIVWADVVDPSKDSCETTLPFLMFAPTRITVLS